MASSLADLDYDFSPPPDCAIFSPTKEEFADALSYLEKIRPVAEQYGIVKIRPPEDWQPPFAVDVDKLKFTPRIQRLNELEAHTRIKLNFLDQVAKFWELQGTTLKIPLVERRALDLFTLKKFVSREGGMEKVNADKKWTKVATDMGYAVTQNKSVGAVLKAHYERILFPLEVFEREERKKAKIQQLQRQQRRMQQMEMGAEKQEIKEEDEEGSDAKADTSTEEEKEYKPHNIPGRMGMKVPAEKDKAGRRSKRYDQSETDSCTETTPQNGTSNGSSPAKKNGAAVEEDSKVNSFSKELARLQFFGAGPKMAGLPSDKNSKDKTRGLKLNFEYDPLAKYMCQNCSKGDSEEQMLLCDGCDDSYHTFCLMPPLAEIPKGDWRCPKCIAAEVSKPMEAFGFEQAQKEYTLQSFGEMADQFKQDYFNMPVHLIPTTLVEKEYWRILENIDEDVMVEYGADLHTMDHGSGFPTLTSKNLSKEDEVYAKSEWNLNRLPVVPNSILRCIDMDISGMKVPWLYVGMCFSTFCWHTEDHWTPSINYLHWGEPKTWYGIPAKYAEKAESVMRESAKELFSGQPDLLHHIVTTMNPNVLQAHGIPVYRADQHAGEFIITFPRGYHAGFNHGYNLAEAVNFAPPDWLEMGRKCVEHYSKMRRYCVFCHDELVCKMATQAHKLTLQVAASTYKDMLVMVDEEKKMRRQLLEAGVTEAEREAFELLPDDERQCALCKTTCFLSALTSVDSKDNEIVCLRHFKSMECDPEKLILRYRYTLDELATLLGDLKARAESYEVWITRVRRTLNAKGDDREDLDDVKEMLQEALDRKYPESELFQDLQLLVDEAEKCQQVANQLDNKMVRTRTRGIVEAKYRLTVDELELFANQLQELPAKVNGYDTVSALIKKVEGFQVEAERLLDMAKPDVDDIQKCIDLGSTLDVELPELLKLKSKHTQTEWMETVQEVFDDPQESTYDHLKELQETGLKLPPHPTVEKALGQIEGLMTQVEEWKTKSAECMAAKQRWSLSKVEDLVKEGESISGGLPNLTQLKEAVRKADDWLKKASSIRVSINGEPFPFLDSLEQLVAKGRPLPIKLDLLSSLETQVAGSRAWRERTARVFLKKNSHITLLDAIVPRVDIGMAASEGRKKKRQAQSNVDGEGGGIIPHPTFVDMTAKDLMDPQSFVNRFKKAHEEEKEAMLKLREKNRSAEEREKNGKNSKVMIECELCWDLFHPLHVALPIPTSPVKKSDDGGATAPSSSASASQAAYSSLRDVKFLCPACARTRRPRLDTILGLLVSLQKQRVRLPEGEALQCLTEIGMTWQDAAKKALKTEEVAMAMKQIQDHSTKKPTEKSSKESDNPLPEIKLSKEALEKLERLMFEGDLLEVSTDESLHIGRIMMATEPRRSKQYPDILELEAELESVREEKLKAKKKRKSDIVPNTSGDEKSADSASASASGPPRAKKQRAEGEPKRKEATKRRPKKPSSSTEDRSNESGEEEEQENCSAQPTCLKPTGKEVDWVQCDACELWFHLHCIGVKQEQLSEDEDFVCQACKPLRHKKKKSEAK